MREGIIFEYPRKGVRVVCDNSAPSRGCIGLSARGYGLNACSNNLSDINPSDIVVRATIFRRISCRMGMRNQNQMTIMRGVPGSFRCRGPWGNGCDISGKAGNPRKCR
jgi:hypothetical protein